MLTALGIIALLFFYGLSVLRAARDRGLHAIARPTLPGNDNLSRPLRSPLSQRISDAANRRFHEEG
jgi:hypothetical protein